MAAPKWHLGPTLILSIMSVTIYSPLSLASRNTMIIASIFVFGVLVDYIDHLSIRRLKKLYKVIFLKQKEARGPVEGWVNWMHTVWALIGVVGFSILIHSSLPLISYVIHILIDGGNRDNILYPNSPLPAWLHKFYPRCLTYSAGLIV